MHTELLVAFPPDLVKAEERDLPTDVDAWWIDAVYTLFLQPFLGIDSASSHGKRQGRWHCNGHNIQGPNNQLLPGCLDTSNHRLLMGLGKYHA